MKKFRLMSVVLVGCFLATFLFACKEGGISFSGPNVGEEELKSAVESAAKEIAGGYSVGNIRATNVSCKKMSAEKKEINGIKKDVTPLEVSATGYMLMGLPGFGKPSVPYSLNLYFTAWCYEKPSGKVECEVISVEKNNDAYSQINKLPKDIPSTVYQWR